MTTTHEVRLTGWRRGIRTISLIDLIRGSTSMSLTAAKQVVDGLLDGQSHSFSFSTPEEASAFITAAEGLGAVTDAADASDEMPDEPNP